MRMRINLYVLLITLFFTGSQAPAQSRGDERTLLDPPMRTTLRIDGRQTTFKGEITAWSFGAFWTLRTGGENTVRIGWDQLKASKVFETVRRLIDRDDAVGYLRLGIEMLRLEEHQLAERAFKWAIRKDPRTRGPADLAILLFEGGEDLQPAESAARDFEDFDGANKKIQNNSLKGDEDEGGASSDTKTGSSRIDDSGASSGSKPWPVISDNERSAHTDRLRHYATTAGVKKGIARRVYETEHFLLATDLTEREMRYWGGQLEEMYDTLLETMSIEKGTNLYAGKCVIFIFTQRDLFLDFETGVMKHPNPGWAVGFCHQRGGDVYIVFYRQPNDADFASVLIHESVHGFMYRYRSPARLPTWANEGLSDYIAGYLSTKSRRPQRHWMDTKSFITQGGDPQKIMRLNYRDGSWPTNDSYSVSHMLVRFLLRYKPVEFKQWINDIKDGIDWEVSMKDRFGIDVETLAQGFADEIKSEKKFSRN